MKTSLRGMLAIIEHEGVVLVPYQDAAKVWTIGVGHTKAAGAPDPFRHDRISIGDALEILRGDLHGAETAVRNTVRVPLAQHQFDALVSFEFNTGALGSHRARWVLNALNRRKWNEAMAALQRWSNVTINGQKVRNVGLVARRKAEAQLFLAGDYGEPFLARVHETWPSKGIVRNLAPLVVGA